MSKVFLADLVLLRQLTERKCILLECKIIHTAYLTTNHK